MESDRAYVDTMTDRPINEYSSSLRAENDENDLFAAIGKKVLGLNLENDEDVPEDERVKVVDEIESLCMNCEQDVCRKHMILQSVGLTVTRASRVFYLRKFLFFARSY